MDLGTKINYRNCLKFTRIQCRNSEPKSTFANTGIWMYWLVFTILLQWIDFYLTFTVPPPYEPPPPPSSKFNSSQEINWKGFSLRKASSRQSQKDLVWVIWLKKHLRWMLWFCFKSTFENWKWAWKRCERRQKTSLIQHTIKCHRILKKNMLRKQTKTQRKSILIFMALKQKAVFYRQVKRL